MSEVAADDLYRFSSLYVIQIGRGRIKVGYSANPVGRLAEHRALAEAFGARPGLQWASPPGTGTPALEDELIAFCAERARQQLRREYFVGVPFTVAVRRAAQLCGVRATVYETLDELAAANTAGRAEIVRADEAARRRAAAPRVRQALLSKFDSEMTWLGGEPRHVATRREAATWLGTGPRQVLRLIASGQLRTTSLESMGRPDDDGVLVEDLRKLLEARSAMRSDQRSGADLGQTRPDERA